jgi:hypothetical protein
VYADRERIPRQQAEHCLQLGNESRELFVKDAMAELATKFQQAAKELERGRPAT